jgi:hypothetical protein
VSLELERISRLVYFGFDDSGFTYSLGRSVGLYVLWSPVFTFSIAVSVLQLLVYSLFSDNRVGTLNSYKIFLLISYANVIVYPAILFITNRYIKSVPGQPSEMFLNIETLVWLILSTALLASFTSKLRLL